MATKDPKGGIIPGSSPARRNRIYKVSQLGVDAPAHSFGSRPATSYGKGAGPGPDVYKLPEEMGRGGPTHIMAQRLDTSNKSHLFNPGPAEYSTNEPSKILKNAPPSYSFGARFKLRKADMVPGPCDYQRPSTAPESAGFSLSSRHPDHASGAVLSPGPGAYSPGKDHMKAAPKFSLGARVAGGLGGGGASPLGKKSKHKRSVFESPGPAAYLPRDACPHKKAAPSFSMGARLRGLRRDETPAGASYQLPAPIGRRKH